MMRSWFLVPCLVCNVLAMGSPVLAQTKAAPKSKAKAKANESPRSTVAPKMKLGRLAPEECVFFLTTEGWRTPPADSKNKSDQLWSVESLQDFLQQLGDEIQKAIASQTENDPNASIVASVAPVFLTAALKHPLAISLVSFTIDANPEVSLAFVIDTETDLEKVREAFDQLISLAKEKEPNSLVETTVEGATFYSPSVPNDEVKVLPQFGFYESYFVMTMGLDMTAKTIERIKGADQAPKWLDATLLNFKIERPSMAWQINVQEIWATVDSLIQDAQVRSALEVSGVKAFKRIACAAGLNNVASIDRMIIEMDGPPAGVFAAFPDRPLVEADFKGIPANPVQATVVCFDLAQLVESILAIAEKFEPAARENFQAIAAQGEQMLGFSVTEDLIASFGDVWSLYISGTEAGGGFIPGFVLSAGIKDQAKLE